MGAESEGQRPTGTITFLFSDIEESTRRLAELGAEAYDTLLRNHRSLLREAFARHAGYEFGSAGDSLFVAFGSAQDAARAAIVAQCALAENRWPDDRPV